MPAYVLTGRGTSDRARTRRYERTRTTAYRVHPEHGRHDETQSADVPPRPASWRHGRDCPDSAFVLRRGRVRRDDITHQRRTAHRVGRDGIAGGVRAERAGQRRPVRGARRAVGRGEPPQPSPAAGRQPGLTRGEPRVPRDLPVVRLGGDLATRRRATAARGRERRRRDRRVRRAGSRLRLRHLRRGRPRHLRLADRRRRPHLLGTGDRAGGPVL